MRKMTSATYLLVVCLSVFMLSGCSSARQNTGYVSSRTAETEEFTSAFTQPFEIICPWAPNGSSDINARTIGQVIGELTGQTVTVSNKTGGGGAIGFSDIKEAAPDGYTLGIITAELNTLPPQGEVSFTQEDFYPIIRMNTLPACIAVVENSPFNDLTDLITYAKEHPDQLKTGDVGTGSIWYCSAAKLESVAGIALLHESYDGASSAAEALVNGELDMVTLETSVMEQYAAEGKVRILAVMAEERLRAFPNYPTCKELGYPVISGSFQGIVCPMGVPDQQKELLEKLFTAAYSSPAYQTFCTNYGLERSYLNAADFRTFLEEDAESVAKILKALDLAK